MASNNPYDAQASTNYKEAFALFDKRGNSRVALESLGDLLRACGQNPTLSEIRDLEKNVGSDCMLLVHYPKFIAGHCCYRGIYSFWSEIMTDIPCSAKLISRPSPRSLTAQVDSANQGSQRSTAEVSRSSTRTCQDLLALVNSDTSSRTWGRR
jgi:hypothetical protein